MPVAFSNSVAASVAPFGLHRTDHVELCCATAERRQRSGRTSDGRKARGASLHAIDALQDGRGAREFVIFGHRRKGSTRRARHQPGNCHDAALSARDRSRRHQDRDRRARRRRAANALRHRVPTPHGDYEGTLRRDRGPRDARPSGSLALRRALHRRHRHAGIAVARDRVCCAARIPCASTAGRSRPISKRCSAATIRMSNDANCFALSEASDGAGAGAPSCSARSSARAWARASWSTGTRSTGATRLPASGATIRCRGRATTSVPGSRATAGAAAASRRGCRAPRSSAIICAHAVSDVPTARDRRATPLPATRRRWPRWRATRSASRARSRTSSTFSTRT